VSDCRCRTIEVHCQSDIAVKLPTLVSKGLTPKPRTAVFDRSREKDPISNRLTVSKGFDRQLSPAVG
jgi:hypothetical protein